MKLCAVVITYYPNVEEAKRNIMQYLPWVDHLIIWENTPKKDLKSHKILLSNYSDKVSYKGTGNNEGISYALNKAIEYARINKFTHLLTMDQDSYWENFEKYKIIVAQKTQMKVFAPCINNKISDINGFCITSGMMIPLSIYTKVGGYYEGFKIDLIDYEFCIRCKSHGIILEEIQECNLIQTFGSPCKIHIFNKTFIYNNYSSERLYEINKNNLILLKSYKLPNGFKTKVILNWLIKNPIKIIIADNSKFKKLWATITGALCGFIHKPIHFVT